MLKEYKTEQIRNVAIVGHGTTGKSTLLDAMLFLGGKIAKIGSPDNGTLTSDFDEEEKNKKISIRSAMGFVEMDGVKINIIDTPGTADFIGETRSAIQAVEAVILVVDAVDGVQIETEKAWRYLKENNVPRIIFVNKMDKERANFDTVVENIKSSLKTNVAVIGFPGAPGNDLKSMVNVATMKLMTPKGDGKDVTVSDIPADLKAKAEGYKNSLMELAAEGEDALVEKFLEGEELTDEEVRRGLKAQISRGKVFPILCGASAKPIGVKLLLEIIKDFSPAPELNKIYKGCDPYDVNKAVEIKASPSDPFAGVVFKTYIDQYAGRFNYIKAISGELLPDTEVLNASKKEKERISKIYALVGNKQEEMPKLVCGDIGVVVKLTRTATKDTLCDTKRGMVIPLVTLPDPVFSYAIYSVNKGDDDKIGQYFGRVTDENPTVKYGFNAETKEAVLSGMGEIQLGIILNTLKEKNKIDVVTKEPRVAYRETITKKAESHYRHKKQTGGHGQFGDVHLRVAPLPRGKGFEFVDSIVGGVVPKQYIPGVQKGIIEGMTEGVLAKYPVVDVWVELFFGSYHDVDSSEMSFKIAARQAFKQGMETAGPQLLEPVMEVSVYADKEYMGDILNDMTSRRGRVLGMESGDDSGSGISVIKATAPLAEMLRYSIDLRAMTSGKATFEMKFSHYDPISGRIAEKVIEERKKQLEDEANK